MKRITTTLIISLIIGTTYSQEQENHRFNFGFSGVSVMNYGLKDIKNISYSGAETTPIYETEKYDLNYQNFAFSYGYGFNFGVYIVNNSKYSLKGNVNFFIEKYKEELTFTLVDVGDGSEIDYAPYSHPFNYNDVSVGYSQTIDFNSDYALKSLLGGGFGASMVLFKKLKHNFNLGAGLFYSQRTRSEFFNGSDNENYFPIISPRGSNTYTTKQIGLCMELEKTYNRYKGFIKLNQNILTVKKKENYGSSEVNELTQSSPLSQNLDYRFPLIINVGIAVEFGKIKN